MRNIELNAAYSTIANGGKYIVPRLYTKVVDQEGRVVLDNTDPEKERVLKKTTCFLLTDAMKDVLTKGTGTVANFTSTAVAGKTGTTEDSNDVWFSGFTPNYTATVWAGYDNNTKLSKNEESLAMIIWKQIMSNIGANKKYSDFKKPDGLTTAAICSDTGQLAVSGYCDHAYTEYFVKGTEPTSYCSVGLKKKQKADDKKKKEEEQKKKQTEQQQKQNNSGNFGGGGVGSIGSSRGDD